MLPAGILRVPLVIGGAVCRGHMEMSKMLLDSGANVNQMGPDKATSLYVYESCG